MAQQVARLHGRTAQCPLHHATHAYARRCAVPRQRRSPSHGLLPSSEGTKRSLGNQLDPCVNQHLYHSMKASDLHIV